MRLICLAAVAALFATSALAEPLTTTLLPASGALSGITCASGISCQPPSPQAWAGLATLPSTGTWSPTITTFSHAQPIPLAFWKDPETYCAAVEDIAHRMYPASQSSGIADGGSLIDFSEHGLTGFIVCKAGEPPHLASDFGR